jgi:hypothetical protein
VAVDLPTVVVQAPAETAPKSLSSLSEAARRALAAHAHATGLHAVDLREQEKTTGIALDPDRAARIARIEDTLRAARGPLDLGDRDALPALRIRVAAAYSEARAHPEDPEAPFLLGEALRTLARIEDVAGDPSGARGLRLRADLIDGGRRIGLSEGGPFDATGGATIDLTLKLIDARASTIVWIDGEERDAKKPVSLIPGEHHVRVTAQGVTIVAQWITLTASGELPLRGDVATTPCSAQDLASALASPAGFQVGCARWMRVVERKESLEIRVCSATSCGPVSTWSTVPLIHPPATTPSKSVWSSKWTWIGVGAAAVVGGTITAWRLGAFDRGEAPPPVWRWEGAR